MTVSSPFILLTSFIVPLIVKLFVLLLIIVPSCKKTLFFRSSFFELMFLSPLLIKLTSPGSISSAPSNTKLLFDETSNTSFPSSFSAVQLYFASIISSFEFNKVSSTITQVEFSFLSCKFLKLKYLITKVNNILLTGLLLINAKNVKKEIIVLSRGALKFE